MLRNLKGSLNKWLAPLYPPPPPPTASYWFRRPWSNGEYLIAIVLSRGPLPQARRKQISKRQSYFHVKRLKAFELNPETEAK